MSPKDPSSVLVEKGFPMFISPIDLVIVLAAVGFGGFYCWAQQRGLLTTGQAAEGEPGTRRISLLTEAAGDHRGADHRPGRA